MSKENVKQMFGKLEKDANLQKKYAELMQIHQKETENKIAEKLIELGKNSGFTFSKDDLMAARAELVDNINSNKELSNDDLEKVAGGGLHKTLMTIASTISLGIGCAVTSIIMAIGTKNRCGEALTTDQDCNKN